MNQLFTNTPYYFADVYSCGAYGVGAYENSEACQTASAPDTGYAPSGVMGIGTDLLVIGGLAAVVLGATVVSFFRRRKSQNV